MAKKYNFDYDLIVIGSGAGGSAAASLAAREGKKVAMVEADTFGGDSPNWSDVPMHAFLTAAQTLDQVRHGSVFGLRTNTVGYNYPSLRAWKDAAVKRTGAANNRKFYENQGIDTYQGRAHFLSPNEVTVNRRHISGKNFLIATGSKWDVPGVIGLNKLPYLTPRTLLEQLRPPKSLYIIGGNAIGVEIAQLMATFGTKVYIADPASRLLPQYDEEVGELMERSLAEQKGVTTLAHTRTISAVKDGILYKVTYARGNVEKSIKVEAILVASNRIPSVDLGLENASVAYTPAGIKVNENLQTSAKHIYAAGDVVGSGQSTHTALLQSRVAVHNILHKNKLTPDYTATPSVVFTLPQIASVGLTADDCLKRDLQVDVALAPLNIISRSNTSDFRDGFVKIIADKKGYVLGSTIVAPNAGDMIAELGLAVKYKIKASELATTPHAFLTWSEAIRVAASKIS